MCPSSSPAPARQNQLGRSGRRTKDCLASRRDVVQASCLFRRAGFQPADPAAMIAVLRSKVHAPQRPIPSGSRVRRWLGHLFREWTIESWRPIAPAFARPEPWKWSDTQVTLAWLGHSTVLINFFGVTILTDPVLFSRVGIRLPGITVGPKRLTAPALQFDELPQIDLILLSHAHFDHFDLRTLRCFDEATCVITARVTSDLLKRTRFCNIAELDWGGTKTLRVAT